MMGPRLGPPWAHEGPNLIPAHDGPKIGPPHGPIHHLSGSWVEGNIAGSMEQSAEGQCANVSAAGHDVVSK